MLRQCAALGYEAKYRQRVCVHIPEACYASMQYGSPLNGSGLREKTQPKISQYRISTVSYCAIQRK